VKEKTAGAEDEAAAATMASRGEVTATTRRAEAVSHPLQLAGGWEEVDVEVEEEVKVTEEVEVEVEVEVEPEVEVRVECVEECWGGADAAWPAGRREEEVEEETASPSGAASGDVTHGGATSGDVTRGGAASGGVTGGGPDSGGATGGGAASGGVTGGGAASRGVTGGGEQEVERESASPSAHVHVSTGRRKRAAVGGAMGLRKAAAVKATTRAAEGGAGGLRKSAAVEEAGKAAAAAARGMTSPDRRCFGADVASCKRAESRSRSPVSKRGGGDRYIGGT